jgi:hypothetical protein
MAPFVAGVCLLATIVCLALAIRKGDFQKIGEKHASIYGFYFIIFLVLFVDVTVCWLISRVREIACEFVLPVFGVLLFLLHLLNAETNNEIAPVTSDFK